MIKSIASNYKVDGYEERTLIGSHKQLEYRIMIAIPKDAPPENGYPIIYALDGDAVFQTLSEAARLQTRKPHGYDPAVIVGIGYPSKEPFDMNRRCYDFTMPAQAENLPVRPNGQEWPEHGGADAFLDFIESELKLEIAQDYPIDSSRQSIFGHSLGGLFVLHALFTRPQMFQSYVAGSPSIWWNNRMVLQEIDNFESFLLQEANKPRLMLTIGEEELVDMVRDTEQLAESLKPLVEQGFYSELVKFSEEGHVSVLPAAISRTVKFALKRRSIV
ncbi:MAG: alpha/beta hydrolase [Candidatus Pristimantibacillus sp.]